MLNLIKLLFEICIFRKGPQDIPAAHGIMQLLVAVYALISFLILFISNTAFWALLQVLVEIAVTFAFAKIILWLFKKSKRFPQTFSALMGTDALLSSFALPAIATIASTSGESALAFIVVIGLMVWHWWIMGHILRHALAESYSFSLGISFLYIVGSYQLMAVLFSGVS